MSSVSDVCDDVTGVEDVGFGSVIKLEVICNKCQSTLTRKFSGHYGCDKCDTWTNDVRYRSIRMFRTDCA